jgi:glycosyltransferase involved in cell wall biosynthesis
LLVDLKRVIAQVQPDLILAGPLQTAGLLVAFSGFHPFVSMSWGYDLLVDAEKSPAWRKATSYVLSHSDAMLGDCEAIRQKAISYGMRSDRIVAFPWGVDLAHFCPRPEQQPDPKLFTLLSTRGWEPIYGVEIIAQAFVKAASRLANLPDHTSLPELRLLMLGNGSLATRLHSIFSQAGLLERVHFAGQIGFARLPDYYRAADLYVSASHSDGSSISLLEAMACGRPALVSDIPGNREWVTPEINGWWFLDGDADALVEAIVQAVCERERLPQLGQAARQVAEQRANWEKNFPQLIAAFQQVLLAD